MMSGVLERKTEDTKVLKRHFQEMQTMLALLLLWAGAVAAQSLRVSPAALPYSGATIAVSWFDRFGTGNPFGAPLTSLAHQ